MLVRETVSHAIALAHDGMSSDLCELIFFSYHILFSLQEKNSVEKSQVYSYHQKFRDYLASKKPKEKAKNRRNDQHILKDEYDRNLSEKNPMNMI